MEGGGGIWGVPGGRSSEQQQIIYIKVLNVQMGNFFMSGKVLKTIHFLKGNNADNSNLILLGLEKQRGITLEA